MSTKEKQNNSNLIVVIIIVIMIFIIVCFFVFQIIEENNRANHRELQTYLINEIKKTEEGVKENSQPQKEP